MKRTIAVSAFGLAVLLGTSEVANAQTNRQIQRQQQKVQRQQQKVLNQRYQLEAQRIQLEQQRQEQLLSKTGATVTEIMTIVIELIATAVITRRTVAERICSDKL